MRLLMQKKNSIRELSVLFVFFLVFLFSCSKGELSNPENTPYIDVYFNDPGVNSHTEEDPTIDEKVARMVDNATESVYFAFYGFYRIPIKEAILRAVKRGLDVQFAGDYDHYLSHDTGYVEYEALLRDHPNAKMSVGNSQSIMHNKWIVVDRKYVMTGTGNITDSEMEKNNNAWVIIRNSELAEDFIREHKQMMNGRFGHAKVRTDYENIFDIGGIKIENYFSPQEEAMSEFIKAVQEAEHSIHFMIFAFTHDGLGRLLVDKHKEFVDKFGSGYYVDDDGVPHGVRGVMDRSQLTHAQYVEVYRAAGACADKDLSHGTTKSRCEYPLDFRRDGNENTSFPGDWQAGGGRLHSKVILVDAGTDNAKVLMGSFNWSPNANENNDENLIIIHSKEISKLFLNKFNQIYAEAKPLPGRKNGDEPLAYQGIIISEVNWAGSRRAICFDEAKKADGFSSVNKIDYDINCSNKYYFDYDGNEFIELYNPNDFSVDISYWTFFFPAYDDYKDPGYYVSGYPNYEAVQKKAVFGFPEGTVIPAKGFFVVYEPDLRNDNQNAYYINPEDLYIPENTNTHQNKVSVYNPYNEMSNFITLYDRRSSTTHRESGIPPYGYPDWQNLCSPAFSYWTDRFSSAQSWPFRLFHATRDSGEIANGYPYKDKLNFEFYLRDSSGNIVDYVGGQTSIERGGFYSNNNPGADLNLWSFIPFDYAGEYTTDFDGDSPDSGNYIPGDGCGNTAATHLFSMERKEPSGGEWPDGSDWNSWENTSASAESDRYSYILENFQERTIATPGKANSRWTSLTP